MSNTAEEKRTTELTEEIRRLKQHLTERSDYMSNADTFDELDRIGELLSEKNELTGSEEDLQYLYLDDGEWFREVKGFVGDLSGMHDANGTELKIGDTVGLAGSNGSVYPRLVMHDMPSQETLTDCKAVKVKDCSELDIQDASACMFTVSLHSCVQDYENSLDRGMEMRL